MLALKLLYGDVVIHSQSVQLSAVILFHFCELALEARREFPELLSLLNLFTQTLEFLLDPSVILMLRLTAAQR